MAFMHAVPAGHTSLEKALLRILQIQREEAPRGSQWHTDLIQRAGRATDSRPAILPAALVRAVDRTRKFRHVAVRGYDTFDPDDAEPAVRRSERSPCGDCRVSAGNRPIGPFACLSARARHNYTHGAYCHPGRA